MKFVIKSLLFVNLILQLTSALRKCFDHDQNLMLTIILLAFSLIGLIGLVIGNRFILVIFSACMTLILIASITIYAIGKTEKDALQPKVPYYVNVPATDLTSDNDNGERYGGESGGRIKSLVNKLLTRGQNKQDPQKGSKTRARTNKTRVSSSLDSSQMRRSMATRQKHVNSSATTGLLASVSDDYSDDPTSSVHQLQLTLASENASPVARSTSARADGGDTSPTSNSRLEPPTDSIKSWASSNNKMDDENAADFNQVPSEQWIAYERYLYEKYLNIVSQSIDLIMHTILGSWLALLLDEDADQCFGANRQSNRSLSSSSSQQIRRKSMLASGLGGGGPKETPVYNYNGVRYSIRPEPSESPGRVMVQ